MFITALLTESKWFHEKKKYFLAPHKCQMLKKQMSVLIVFLDWTNNLSDIYLFIIHVYFNAVNIDISIFKMSLLEAPLKAPHIRKIILAL